MKPDSLLTDLVKKIPTVKATYSRDGEKNINPAYCDIEHCSPLCPNEKRIWVLRGDMVLAVGIKNAYTDEGNTTLFSKIGPAMLKYIDPYDRYGHPSLAIPDNDYDGSVYYAGWLRQHKNHLEIFLQSGRYQNNALTPSQTHYLELYLAIQFMNKYETATVIFYDWNNNDEFWPFLENVSFPAKKLKRMYSHASINSRSLLDIALSYRDDTIAIDLFKKGTKMPLFQAGKYHLIHVARD